MMNNVNQKEFLWVEKYRPASIDDCILPDSLKKVFKDFVSAGDFPNLLLTGTAGVGKTTVAQALAHEIGCDFMKINASADRNIDTLRTKIQDYVSSVSWTGKQKIVLLDEADNLNANSFQPALRGFMEEFSANARFILTCNFKNKLIDAIHSRCTVIEFRVSKDDEKALKVNFLKRVLWILENEKIKHDAKVVAKFVNKHFPDMRGTLNHLQQYAASGEIDEGVLSNVVTKSMDNLLKALREKNFTLARQWVAENSSTEPTAIFRGIYDHMYDHVQPDSIPQLIVHLADYQYKSAFVADQEINLMAFLVMVMAEVDFKG